MSAYIFDFREVDKTKADLVGGKGANLGELTKVIGIHVPEGFCISTEVFKRIVKETPSINELLEQLSLLKVDDRDKIAELSKEIRTSIEGAGIPSEVREEIVLHLSGLGENNTYAVRSSATAEDLPTASFAGQQDSYLNIVGTTSVLTHISRCWASLFTERAIIYRLQNEFDHRKVFLSVIIQNMVFSQAAGILFTADPVTSNRKVLSIDAGFGLGEAMVSGLVNADNYKVIDGEIVDKKIAAKKLAVYALKGGGTEEVEFRPEQQSRQALKDEQILVLGRMGRKIEEHFGSPQDIEWCLADDSFYIVQSRPITTLFPVPQADDKENRVYLSVGHQQMMTDPMKPLGLSFFLLTTRASMRVAGGRLFVDITAMLASPASRKKLIDTMGQNDPLTKDAVMNIAERKDFIKTQPEDNKDQGSGIGNRVISLSGHRTQIDNDPAIPARLIKRNQNSVEELRQNIQAKSGSALFDFILDDIQRLKEILFDPQSFAVFMAAMDASTWLNEKMMEWLGEKNVADTISQSVPNNVTSEMGLALLDIADVIRPYPEVIAYLQSVKDDNFLDELFKFKGGQEIRNAIYAFLNKFGMRCAGEIDITRTRWSEKPAILIHLILGNIKNLAPNSSHRKFEQGRQEAIKKEKVLLERLTLLPDGQQKAEETKRMTDLVRNFIGYREYPKYGIVSRYFEYKKAMLKEAEQLVQSGVIHEKEDIYYLSFEELHEVVRTKKLDYAIIDQRKAAYKLYEKLTPPRVITSDGEIVTGKYNRENLPVNAIVGLAVSSGVIEGRARVILKMEDANMEDGDILVTSFTDPSWTPLFVSIKGLVTEVGGLMTHGAVIAREYGLPAVVGVEHATELIKNGQRIRVNGTDGYVEIL